MTTPWSKLGRWGPYENPAEWLRSLAITLAAAVFLSFSGAFTSGQVPFPVRLAYWLILTLLGWLWGSFVARAMFSGAKDRGWGVWLRTVAVAAVMAAPFCFVVAAASHMAFGATFALRDAPGLFLSVFSVALVMVALNVLVDRPATTHAAAADDPPPKFLDRLPLKLRGAEIWAVEAEDHYLRLHTSKGQDLILMRLSDAIAELEGIEGAQVHRSWWVAREAIADARRGDGRAVLTLKDGAEAPVSRTYARTLRELNWI